MKKIIIFLCIFFVCCFSVLAQNQQEEKTETLPQTKNELHFKMGMFPYTESIVGSLASIGNTGDSFALPVFSVQYLYYVEGQVFPQEFQL